MPKPTDKCARPGCVHTYEFHARDLAREKEKCWHGAVVGECCECLEFVEAK